MVEETEHLPLPLQVPKSKADLPGGGGIFQLHVILRLDHLKLKAYQNEPRDRSDLSWAGQKGPQCEFNGEHVHNCFPLIHLMNWLQ